MAENAVVTQIYRSLERLQSSVSRSTVFLASGTARVLLLVLGTMFLFWQLYFFAWIPLRESGELPAGVRAVEAQLSVEDLERIRDERTQRLQHAPNLFTGADQHFVVSTPAPVGR